MVTSEDMRCALLKPLGMSANVQSKALHVPAGRINDIVLERRSVTPDTAFRLARYSCGDAQSWLNLQQMYDLTARTPHLMPSPRSAVSFL